MLSWQMKNKLFGWDYIQFQWGFQEQEFRVCKHKGKLWVNIYNKSYEVLPDGILKGYHHKYKELTDLRFEASPKQVLRIEPIRCLHEEWKSVVDTDTHEMKGVTQLEAVALANYYKGMYDMACTCKTILEEK